jgi:hypothetical protein
VEKISQIVRGSPRVASVDLKNSAPVRSGTPSFGRPVMESSGPTDRSMSTAQKAVAIHNEMLEQKKVLAGDHTMQAMADNFFLTRVRKPDDAQPAVGGEMPAPGAVKAAAAPSLTEEAEGAEEGVQAPAEELLEAKYTPRGSFINVHA